MNMKHFVQSVLAFLCLMAAPVFAQDLSKNDLGFALGAGASPELMSKEEMITTKGERAGWVIHGYFDRYGNYTRYTPPPPPPPPVVDRSRPNRSIWVTHSRFTVPSSPHW